MKYLVTHECPGVVALEREVEAESPGEAILFYLDAQSENVLDGDKLSAQPL